MLVDSCLKIDWSYILFPFYYQENSGYVSQPAKRQWPRPYILIAFFLSNIMETYPLSYVMY